MKGRVEKTSCLASWRGWENGKDSDSRDELPALRNVRDESFGKFYSCDQYPACKSIFTMDDDGKFDVKKKAQIKKTGKKCPDCEKQGRDGELIERKNRKDNSTFIGCSKWPKCNYSESSS